MGNLLLLTLIQILICTVTKAYETSWTYEFLEVNYNYSENDFLEFDAQVVRISRGVSGFGGYMLFKKDILEDFFLNLTVAYSVSGNRDSFLNTPFRIPKVSFTTFMNDYYAKYIDPLQECLTNAPVIEGKFELPFEKRRIEFTKCLPTTERMPSYMRPGYYLLNYFASGIFDAYIEFLVKVVMKN